MRCCVVGVFRSRRRNHGHRRVGRGLYSYVVFFHNVSFVCDVVCVKTVVLCRTVFTCVLRSNMIQYVVSILVETVPVLYWRYFLNVRNMETKEIEHQRVYLVKYCNNICCTNIYWQLWWTRYWSSNRWKQSLVMIAFIIPHCFPFLFPRVMFIFGLFPPGLHSPRMISTPRVLMVILT